MSSNSDQYTRVRQKFFSSNNIVKLLHIDITKLNNVKYEKTKSGDIYPHQYGKIVISDVIKTENL